MFKKHETTALTLTLLASIVFTSCKKETEKKLVKYYSTHQISLPQSELYVYKTGFSGDEEGGNVTIQGKNHVLTEVTRDDLFEIVYQYQSKPDFVGKDTVQVMIEPGWNGVNGYDKNYYHNFYFEIE